MIHHLVGKFVEKTPTYVVLECGGVGYLVHISLTTFSQISNLETGRLLIHPVYREDAQLLFGFYDKTERDLFVLLTGVSGVGAATARMILSGMAPGEVVAVIQSGDDAALKAIKGIGAKTAQRIIVDLQDKLGGDDWTGAPGSGGSGTGNSTATAHNTEARDALAALCSLGFDRKRVNAVLDKALKAGIQGVEPLIKEALKRL
jgi:Holliday junction DNA helicase RuvA